MPDYPFAVVRPIEVIAPSPDIFLTGTEDGPPAIATVTVSFPALGIVTM